MNDEIGFKINSYKDLEVAKKLLKVEIEVQEIEFKNNPIFKISSSFFKGNSFKGSFQNSFTSLSTDNYIKAIGNIISTILMTNKKTRKFFVAFLIAKEMIPYTIQKINDLIKN